MPSYRGTLAKIRSIADSPDLSVSSKYSSEAEKVIFPKIKSGSNGLHENILNQIESEYQEAFSAFKGKISKNLTRLKLYNNQMKAEDTVGDPLIFTNHQTVIASLYYDRLQSEFEPRQEDDEEVAENVSALAEFDYDEMWKPWNDYQWDWDAGFFGYGLKWIYEFDRKSKTPIQSVWDPASFLRDPRATSVNGDRSRNGAMRFGGLEVFMTLDEMKKNPEYFNLDRLQSYGKGDGDTLSYEADRMRRLAQGINTGVSQAVGTNEQFCILRWLTKVMIGDKITPCIVESANGRKVIVRLTPLKTNYWPLVKRDMFPMSHSWDGVSIPDLTEDKQRFRAVLLNVIGKSARADVEPMYMFDKTKISPNTDFKFGFNKFIPINGPVGENVVLPLHKSQPGTVAQFVLDFLDVSTQKALATPELRQGVPSKDQRTLGENQLISAGVDTRYSLTARVWGWSEKEEWKMWLDNYDNNFEDGIDEKIIKLNGVFSSPWRTLKRENIIPTNPLGLNIKIESKEISNQKKQLIFNKLGVFLSAALQDPTADKIYSLRFWGKQILPRETIERMLPLSIDEMMARKENEKLSENKPVEVRLEDNHIVHFRENSRANDTYATRAHLKAHQEAILAKRIFPAAFPPMPEETAAMAGGNNMSNSAPAMVNQMNSQQNPNLGSPTGMETSMK